MKICLIGCGKMGSSLLEGWSSLKVIKHITIIEPNLDEIPIKLLNIKSFNFYKTIEEAENFSFDMTILAVKPAAIESQETLLKFEFDICFNTTSIT